MLMCMIYVITTLWLVKIILKYFIMCLIDFILCNYLTMSSSMDLAKEMILYKLLSQQLKKWLKYINYTDCTCRNGLGTVHTQLVLVLDWNGVFSCSRQGASTCNSCDSYLGQCGTSLGAGERQRTLGKSIGTVETLTVFIPMSVPWCSVPFAFLWSHAAQMKNFIWRQPAYSPTTLPNATPR
jgi:hypothetical protein